MAELKLPPLPDYDWPYCWCYDKRGDAVSAKKVVEADRAAMLRAVTEWLEQQCSLEREEVLYLTQELRAAADNLIKEKQNASDNRNVS